MPKGAPGKPKTKIHNQKNRLAHLGKKNPKISLIQTGKNNHQWRGNLVSYKGLHKWVTRWNGKPQKCEICNKTFGWFHWANKSRNYKRDLTDWIRLCVKCHKKYDKK